MQAPGQLQVVEGLELYEAGAPAGSVGAMMRAAQSLIG